MTCHGIRFTVNRMTVYIYVCYLQFITAMLLTGRYGAVQTSFWLGGTDANQEGGWEWSDNSPFAYFHWAAGKPKVDRCYDKCKLSQIYRRFQSLI